MIQKNLSIHILWQFLDGPWGGGNQFLKALRDRFVKLGICAEEPEVADIILFNSHQFQKELLKLKFKYPKKVFVHRVDGPLFLTRGEQGKKTDEKIFYFNDLVADGTVFQSMWSMNESFRRGLAKNMFETCIVNAPDPEIFFSRAIDDAKQREKIRLISTTWSSNPRKGFDIYHYLDKYLDFEKYSMTFVGNSDTIFDNITMLPPQPSRKLAAILREHDIFIAASTMEPCSNSFLEALHCGLPVLARNDSSYPELISDNGLLFDGKNDVLDQLKRISECLAEHRKRINVVPMSEVAERYVDFFWHIFQSIRTKEYVSKKISFIKYLYSKFVML